MDDTGWTLTDLARQADVSPRTIRYYISMGLLPGPTGQGPASQYGGDHLARLQVIKSLQDRHVPLAKIRGRLEAMTDEEIRAEAGRSTSLGRSIDDPVSGAGTAMDYIRGVLGEHPVSNTGPPTPAPPPMASVVPPDGLRRQLARAHLGEVGASYEIRPAKPLDPGAERSTWERISLTPDIELHVRRPLDARSNKRLHRLVELARDLFREDGR